MDKTTQIEIESKSTIIQIYPIFVELSETVIWMISMVNCYVLKLSTFHIQLQDGLHNIPLTLQQKLL